jgi:hypothetical protein
MGVFLIYIVMEKITGELLKELGFVETQMGLWNNGVFEKDEFKIAMDGNDFINDCYTIKNTDKCITTKVKNLNELCAFMNGFNFIFIDKKEYRNKKEFYDKFGFDNLKNISTFQVLDENIKTYTFLIPVNKTFPDVSFPYKEVNIKIPKDKIIVIGYYL